MAELAKYNQAATFDVPLQIAGTLDLYASGSIVAGDVKISKDGGAFANVTTLPTEAPAASGIYTLSLSATELSAERVMVKFVDQTSPKAFEPRIVLIQTYGNASARHAFDLDSSTVTPGTGSITAAVIATDAIDADALAADAVTEIAAGVANSGGLSSEQDQSLTDIKTILQSKSR